MEPVRVGLLGCGAIAPAYLRNLTTHFAGAVEVVACADTVPEAAQKRATEFGVPRACGPEELLATPEIELVINLTPAPAHHATSLQVLQAGKHLFTEKPLALSRAAGKELVRVAADRGVTLAGASDTFLGAGLQWCRRLIDEGRIGTPVAASALVTIPAFGRPRYHQVFRGALLDLGPYYLGALVALLGPVHRVTSAAEIRWREKIADDGEATAGQPFAVDLPTSVAAALEFADGTVASLVASCDVHGYFPRTEICGTAGALTLNDANGYGGKVVLRTPKGEEVFEQAPGFAGKGRGLGVAEQALAIRAGHAPRAHGGYLYHVLDALLAVHDASPAGRHVKLESSVERPAPFDSGTLPAGKPPPAAATS
jgi:predicted dehydrogenase